VVLGEEEGEEACVSSTPADVKKFLRLSAYLCARGEAKGEEEEEEESPPPPNSVPECWL
jgi:hypothetical protein